MTSVIEIVNLWYIDNRSDKVYNVKLELKDPTSDKWIVDFEYGRRGSNLVKGTKTPTPTSYAKARTVFNSLVSSKVNKGYNHVGDEKQMQNSISRTLLQMLDIYYQKDLVTNNELTKLQTLLRSSDFENQKLAEKLITSKISK
jgi:predicted DNA-binding WGR domain protein